jgi:hypothetical protein
MGARSRTIPACAVFGAALLAGWTCRQALSRNDATLPTPQADPAAAQAEALPSSRGDLEVRIWLAGALGDADASRLEEIAALLAAVPELDEKAWHGLFSCWFLKDPAAAWAFAADSGTLRGIALEEWAALDPAAARAAADSPSTDEWLQLVRGAGRKDVVVAFHFLGEALAAGLALDFDSFVPLHPLGMEPLQLAELARTDPLLAVKWAERFKRSSLLGAVLSGWHESNPAEALTWLEQRPDRDKILFDLADYLEDIDVPYRPALADLLVDLLPAGNDRLEALHQVLESLGRVDPDLAAKEAARIFPDPELRAEAIGKIASIVAETDFDKAWQILDQLDPSVQGIRRVDLPSVEVSDGGLTRSVNAFSSYQWELTSMRGLVSPADIRSDLLQSLLDVDKEAAIRLMDRIPADDFAGVGEAAFDTWHARDPEEAVRWLATKLGDQGELDDAGDLLERDWQDPAALRDLIQDLPAGTVRSALARRAAADLAESDPQAALRFARDFSTAPEVVEEVYQTWAENDARAAFEQLAADPDAPPSVWARIAGEALNEAPEEFTRLVAELPDGAARDAAAAVIVQVAGRSDDPLPAAGWALAIRGEAERQAALEEVFQRLGGDLRIAREESTAESLRELVASSDLMPEAEKARWLERIGQEFTTP